MRLVYMRRYSGNGPFRSAIFAADLNQVNYSQQDKTPASVLPANSFGGITRTTAIMTVYRIANSVHGDAPAPQAPDGQGGHSEPDRRARRPRITGTM